MMDELGNIDMLLVSFQNGQDGAGGRSAKGWAYESNRRPFYVTQVGEAFTRSVKYIVYLLSICM